MQTIGLPAPGRLLVVDALRGFGALWVCALHSRQILWIGLSAASERRGGEFEAASVLERLTAPISLGSAGVMLFFVLSGYCIHRPQARGAGVDLPTYLARRTWRIYPVLALAILVTLALDTGTRAHMPDDAKLGDNSWQVLLSNLLMLQGIATSHYGSDSPLWSLSIEFHLYLVYLALLPFARRYGNVMLISGSLAVSLVSQLLIVRTAPHLMIFPPYLFTWVLGMLVAEMEAKQRVLPARLCTLSAIVTISLGLGLLAVRWFFCSQLVLGVGFALLLHRLIRAHVTPRPLVLPLRGLAWLGVFSFTLYAMHEPLVLFLRAVLLNGQPATELWASLAVLPACVGIAWVLYQLVERWTLRLPAWLQRLTTARARQPAPRVALGQDAVS